MMVNRSVAACLAMSVVMLIGGCGGASGPATPFPSLGASTVVFTARATQFTTQDVHVPADTLWTLALDNLDGLPHNVVVMNKDNAVAFASTLVSGPKLYMDAAPKLAAGAYQFTCSVHPEMHGTLTVP